MYPYFLEFPTAHSTNAIERIVLGTMQKQIADCAIACIGASEQDIKRIARSIVQEIKVRIYQQLSEEQLLYKDDETSLSESIDLQTRKLSAYIENEVETHIRAIQKRPSPTSNSLTQ